MIKIEHTEVFGFDAAIRGMRSPMNSWDKSDSVFYYRDCGSCLHSLEDNCQLYDCTVIGENDLKLMKNLSNAGTDHSKYLRFITVTADITAPLYWWKEYDTYKVGTVANSCSTMHKIHAKEFTLDDFSHEHLTPHSLIVLQDIIINLNQYRMWYIDKDDKRIDIDTEMSDECYTKYKKDLWWQMIQLLPSSYNQKRTVLLNYQVLKNMYHARNSHKLDEWLDFCRWCESLPYFKEICVEV